MIADRVLALEKMSSTELFRARAKRRDSDCRRTPRASSSLGPLERSSERAAAHAKETQSSVAWMKVPRRAAPARSARVALALASSRDFVPVRRWGGRWAELVALLAPPPPSPGQNSSPPLRKAGLTARGRRRRGAVVLGADEDIGYTFLGSQGIRVDKLGRLSGHWQQEIDYSIMNAPKQTSLLALCLVLSIYTTPVPPFVLLTCVCVAPA